MPTSQELTEAYDAAKADFALYTGDAARQLVPLAEQIVAHLGGGRVDFLDPAGVPRETPVFSLADRGVLRVQMRVTLVDGKTTAFALEVFKNPGWKYSIEGFETGQPISPADQTADRILTLLQDQVRNEFRDWVSGRASPIRLSA